jgi:hypothetical protein
MMNTQLFLNRPSYSLFPRLAAILLVVLASCSLTSCDKSNDETVGSDSESGDFLDAARRGDVREVKA